MSESSDDKGWEAWRTDVADDPDVERFKWGWNATDGEVVWRVSGPGDGFPEHSVELGRAWGRELDLAGGDVIGAAEYRPAATSQPAVVIVRAV